MNQKVSGPQRTPPVIWFCERVTAVVALDCRFHSGFTSTKPQPYWNGALDQRSSSTIEKSPSRTARESPALACQGRGCRGRAPGMGDQKDPLTMACPTSQEVACQVPRRPSPTSQPPDPPIVEIDPVGILRSSRRETPARASGPSRRGSPPCQRSSWLRRTTSPKAKVAWSIWTGAVRNAGWSARWISFDGKAGPGEVVVGEDPVPGVDHAVAPAAPVQGSPDLEGGGQAAEEGPLRRSQDHPPGHPERGGERVALLVEPHLDRLPVPGERGGGAPVVGHGPAQVELQGGNGAGVPLHHVEEEVSERPGGAHAQRPLCGRRRRAPAGGEQQDGEQASAGASAGGQARPCGGPGRPERCIR